MSAIAWMPVIVACVIATIVTAVWVWAMCKVAGDADRAIERHAMSVAEHEASIP